VEGRCRVETGLLALGLALALALATAVPGRAADPCASAKAMAEAGATKDAQAAYVKLLQKTPPVPCAKTGLSDLNHPPKAWVTRAADWMTQAAATALVLLVASLLAGLILLLFGYLPPVRWVYRRLWVVRHVLRPRLTIEDLDDAALGGEKVGHAMSGRIRERLQRFREEALDEETHGDHLDRSGSNQPLFDTVSDNGALQQSLEKLSEASEQTKVIGALTAAVVTALPIPRYKLTGVIEPSRANVPMATVALERNGRLLGTIAVDLPALPEKPPGGEYLRLCDASAVWVQYHVAGNLSGDEPDPRRAESYAWVRAGLDLFHAGKDERALAAFDAAIEQQPANWAAHVNRIAVLRNLQHPGIEDEIQDALTAMEQQATPW
jgi:tetratricopeptide (TPR) repeat protein